VVAATTFEILARAMPPHSTPPLREEFAADGRFKTEKQRNRLGVEIIYRTKVNTKIQV
jgi:hypothetical protein